MATSRFSLRRRLLLVIFSPVLLAVAYCVVMLGFSVVVYATDYLLWALGLAVVVASGIYLVRRRATAPVSVVADTNPVLTAAQAYQEKSRNLTPSTGEFSAWVDSLPLFDRSRAEGAGLARCWGNSFSFRRFVLERRGHDFVDFLAENLSKEEFCNWVDMAYSQPA